MELRSDFAGKQQIKHFVRQALHMGIKTIFTRPRVRCMRGPCLRHLGKEKKKVKEAAAAGAKPSVTLNGVL